jgi:hypothetical protein
VLAPFAVAAPLAEASEPFERPARAGAPAPQKAHTREAKVLFLVSHCESSRAARRAVVEKKMRALPALLALAPFTSAAPSTSPWVSFSYGGSALCLASPPAALFPCAGGAANSCPVFLAPCASPSANWSTTVEPGALISGFECAEGGCGLNVDCDSDAVGAVVKLAAGVPRAAITFDAAAGQLVYTARSGARMCLTGGLGRAPTPPCFAGESFLPNQVTIDDCSAPSTRGWRLAPPAAAGAAAGPCDVYGAAGTPCVAAHSLTRALYGTYGGPLYAVQRAADNATLDIAPVAPGGAADAAAQDAFCGAIAPPPPSVPRAGTLIRLRPAAHPQLALRHCDSEAYVNPFTGGGDFQFTVVPALAGAAFPTAVSLQSVNYPTRYLAPLGGAAAGGEAGRVGIVAAPDALAASWAVAFAGGQGGGGAAFTLANLGAAGGSLAIGGNLTGACAPEYAAPSAGVFLAPAATAWRLDDGSAGGACTVLRIYDQSPFGNDLGVAPPGGQARSNAPVRAADFPLALGAARVYGALFQTGEGYRRDATRGMAVGDAPETILMVTSNASFNAGCCFDYGNAEVDNRDHGPGTMEAFSFSFRNINATAAGWCGGAGAGPWAGADLESGIWSCATPGSRAPAGASLDYSVVTAMVKGDGGRGWALRGGDAAGGGPLLRLWDGPRPPRYAPMQLQGAIILGIGGDSSHGSVGVFLEGAIVANYTSDAADAAAHANIAAAGYRIDT